VFFINYIVYPLIKIYNYVVVCTGTNRLIE